MVIYRPRLNLPACAFKIRNVSGRTQIFDRLRRKYIALTPEEWVRQHFIFYLIEHKKFPAGLIVAELSISVNRMRKRCDLVAHDTSGKPLLIVECKSPEIKINDKVFDQAARYNISLRVSYLAITNGMQHYFCKVDFENKTYSFLRELPEFGEMLNVRC